MNLLNFLDDNNFSNVNESVRIRDIEKAITLIQKFLLKRDIYPYKFTLPLNKEGKVNFGVLSWNNKNYGVCFCWERDNTAQISSLLFTKDFDNLILNWTGDSAANFKWEVAVECKGASMVKICQLVDDVMNGRIGMTAADINKNIKDYQLWESESEEEATIIENLKTKLLVSLNEASNDPVIRDLEKKKTALYMKIRNWKKSNKDVSSLQQQYDDIVKQLADARVAVKAGLQTTLQKDSDIEKIQQDFEEDVRATPEERFGDMESYILNVIMGIRPSAIICGAPGVGKTFRIMKAIKSFGKEKGQDYGVIKGKSTAANLYMMFHDYKEEGQLIVIDDADEVVTDPVAINLIKAATDSSDERWVSYGTSRPPEMPEEKAMMCDDYVYNNGKYYYPKEFLMKGGLIIITNMNAGQIDTAIKNRALMCDLNFTVEEILGLVKNLAPYIKPNVLSDEAKQKALAYLEDLSKKTNQLEISIRSFTLVAGLYDTGAPEADVQRRIREQMKLQFARGGKRY